MAELGRWMDPGPERSRGPDPWAHSRVVPRLRIFELHVGVAQQRNLCVDVHAYVAVPAHSRRQKVPARGDVPPALHALLQRRALHQLGARRKHLRRIEVRVALPTQRTRIRRAATRVWGRSLPHPPPPPIPNPGRLRRGGKARACSSFGTFSNSFSSLTSEMCSATRDIRTTSDSA